ncbi:hypothetical protein Tco_0708351, partial [Tanacetum coccineum]
LFWFTVKKVKKSSSYQFDIDNKTCQIDVELFQEILDNIPRVPNQEFTVPPLNDSLIDFLPELGYKGQLRHNSKIKKPEDVRSCLIPGLPMPSYTTSCLNTNKSPRDKKATAASKKKRAKKMESSDEESEEEEERLTRRKPRAAQFQIDTQKAIKASKQSSRFQHQSGGSNEGASRRPEVSDEPIEKSADSDEGAGTSPEVPDETKDKSKARDDLDDWGSTGDKTFLFDDKDEKIEDIPWVSTDDDETEDEDEEDDASIDIKKTDDERTNTEVEDQVKGVAEMNIACFFSIIDVEDH